MAPRRIPCTTCSAKHQGCRYKETDDSCERCTKQGLSGRDSPAKFAAANSDSAATSPVQRRVLNKKRHSKTSKPRKPYAETAERLWTDGTLTLVMGVDAGTSNFSTYFQLMPTSQELTPGLNLKPNTVFDPNNAHDQDWRIPAHAAINQQYNSSELVCSSKSIHNMLAISLHGNDVFRLLKLELVTADNHASTDQQEMVADARRRNRDTLDRYRQRVNLPQGVESGVDVLQGLLTHYWIIIFDTLKRKYSSLSSEEIQGALERHSRIVVAVPEIWTASMNNSFRHKLRKAGFPNVHVRSEPKLAAAAVAKKQQDDQDLYSKADQSTSLADTIRVPRITVDMGGGTTDLVGIEILQYSPVLLFHTLAPPDGSVKGGKYLNSIARATFKRLLASQLPEIAAHVKMTEGDVVESLIQGFEKEKRLFSSHDKQMPVKIVWNPVTIFNNGLPPMSLENEIDIGPNFIRLSWALVQEIFDEYLKEIYELIDNQLQSLPGTNILASDRVNIDLIGGGSRIPYIYEQIAQNYMGLDHGGRKITVTSMQEDKSLVAEGALLAAIDPTLGRREFARTSYGIVMDVGYDERNPVHAADRKLRQKAPAWSTQTHELLDCWFGIVVEATDLRNPRSKMQRDDWIEFAKEELRWPCDITQKIYECSDKSLAEQDDWSINKRKHKNKVRKLTTLHLAVHEADVSWPLQNESGREFYRIHFRVRTEWDGLCGKFLFFVSRNGEPIQTAKDERAAL